mgnify:CR=1 FL=1
MFVHSITMDGTTTNINAMKLSGCKITNSDELNESFTFDGYDCKVIEVAEKFFRCFVSGTKIQNISSDKKVFLKLRHAILNELFQRKLFIELNEHDKEHGLLFGDLHSSQVIKVIVNKYLQMRCYRYAQQFTKNTIQKGKLGLRQVTNKLMLFKGL